MEKENLIEKYYSETLSAEEKQHLLALIESDPELKQDLQFQEELRAAIAAEERQQLKEHLKTLDHRTKTITLRKWLSVAATIVILLGLGWAFLYNSEPNYDQLYATHFEAYPNVIAPTVRDGAQTHDDNVIAAFRYYDNKDYTKASKAFNALYNENQQDYAQFYYAVSLMGANETEKAIAVLESSTWNIPENYETITAWYLGLNYLKVKDKEKAKRYLEKVATSDKPLATSAQTILNDLK